MKLLTTLLLLVAVYADAKPAPALLKVPATFSQLPESCWPVDYTEHIGPIRNQGDIGWCFAYAAADLISQRVGGFVSAIDIGSQYYLNDPRELVSRKEPPLVEYLKHYPDFTEDVLASRAYAAGNAAFRKRPSVDLMDGGWDDVAAVLANGRGLCPESRLPSTNGFQPSQLKKLRKYIYTSLRNQRNSRDEAILKANAEWSDAIDRVCQREPNPTLFIPVHLSAAASADEYRRLVQQGRLYPEDVGREILGRVNFALSNGRIASIDYDANMIADFGGEQAPHASTIVARNMVNGKCQYLLRNSWGADCSGYRPELQKRCMNGHMWVTGPELLHSVFGVTFLR